MIKILWVALPAGLYAAYVAVAAARRRLPSRRALNVHTSLLLMGYLLSTAGLGVFWVANQQLPVFDLHYLFGYTTLLVVVVHLSFNLPLVWRHFTAATETKSGAAAGGRSRTSKRGAVGGWLAALGGVALSFLLGMRHGKSQLTLEWSAASADSSGPVEAVVRYHEFSSASRIGVLARAPSVDWGPEPEAVKRYPTAKRAELSVYADAADARSLSDALVGPRPEAARSIDAARLSSILLHTAGVTADRGGWKLRAAPSSGALFPTEVYVAVDRVDGVSPGLYHYDPDAHALEHIGDAVSLAALGAPHAASLRAPVTVILTSIFKRTGFKYRDRAYRYAVADAGHLLENLRIAAGEAGPGASPLAMFDEERAARTLGVDGLEEGVLLVVPLAEGSTVGAGAFDFASPPAGDATSIGVTGMVHVATSLRTAAHDEPTERLELPAPSRAPRTALATIARRRSERRFSDAAIALGDLGSILHDAAQPPLLSTAVRIHVVANRVTGLEPGIYRFHGTEHALELTRRGRYGEQARSAALAQEAIGDAAAVVILSADRRAMFARQGARGYRHAFLEAGMVGQRILLGAVARDLGGCPVGAFYDDDAAELIGVDPALEWVVHFTALGAPASPTP